jgi:hypothetical protein
MRLFDGFPFQERQRQVDEWLTPGSIFRLWCPWILKADKNKFLLAGPSDHDMLMLMINTNPRYAAPPQSQVQLSPADYQSGVKDVCYVNCNSAITELTYNDVKQQVLDDSDCFCCRITPADLQAVIAAIKFADDLSTVQQDAFLAAFTEAA